MATTFATPGVYVQEVSSFPPSVAQVATAIPIFIGYTETAVDSNGKSVFFQGVSISSWVEYQKYFGGPPDLVTNVVLNPDYSVNEVTATPSYQMYNALYMFFNNGGTNCYIFSVGAYKSVSPWVLATDFTPTSLPPKPSCFDVIQKMDEPTLIVIPDAILLGSTQFYPLMQDALNLCAAMQNRFTIMDVYNGTVADDGSPAGVISSFRNGIGDNNLNYGAAYYPFIETSIPFPSSYMSIEVGYDPKLTDQTPIHSSSIFDSNPAFTNINQAVTDYQSAGYKKLLGDLLPLSTPIITVAPNTNPSSLSANIDVLIASINDFVALGGTFTSSAIINILTPYITASAAPPPNTLLETYIGQLEAITSNYPTGGSLTALNLANTLSTGAKALNILTPTPANPFSTAPAGSLTTDTAVIQFIYGQFASLFNNISNLINNFISGVNNIITGFDTSLGSSYPIYQNIQTAISGAGLTVPPSGAMAGVYAATDSTRGVWKAPANVSLNSVIQPSVPINDNDQAGLNIDVIAGKSINAIRAFTGQGTLVWGARTLAGNDPNWRYISVRRFYIMVETSVKYAAFQFVFEPNVGTTWIRLRSMIESYLTGIWRQGGLAGSKPEQAFYVSVGLGQTMTQDDILNGLLIVEIGMAPVRPAEFIILRFTQIQQQA